MGCNRGNCIVIPIDNGLLLVGDSLYACEELPPGVFRGYTPTVDCISEISAEVGFLDVLTFSKFFAKRTGLSPTNFRKNQTLKNEVQRYETNF